MILLISTSRVAGITGVSHHTGSCSFLCPPLVPTGKVQPDPAKQSEIYKVHIEPLTAECGHLEPEFF
jgi:hypothetical protein